FSSDAGRPAGRLPGVWDREAFAMGRPHRRRYGISPGESGEFDSAAEPLGSDESGGERYRIQSARSATGQNQTGTEGQGSRSRPQGDSSEKPEDDSPARNTSQIPTQ